MTTISRRSILAATAVLAAGAAPGLGKAQPAVTDFSRNRLVLLGTKGGPNVWNDVHVPSSNLLIYDGVPYLIDAGFGVTFRLLQAHVDLADLRYVFITHLHSDHSIELGPLLYNAWVNGLQHQVDAYGPAGIENLVAASWDANRFDIDTRIVDEGRSDPRKLVEAKRFDEGVIMSGNGVKVSALRNKHPPITDSYALKFEFGSKSIVFSGDTTYFPPLAEFAKGADILVHEIMYRPWVEAKKKLGPSEEELVKHLLASHTVPEDVGRIASQAGVKKLVLNHFVPAPSREFPPDLWLKAVSTTFDGEIVVGDDLMEIPLP
ncbi:MAG: MBL fold metallo-hydrolase [Rhodobacteraceae bacterium]|nr:MBL fold metallo-hydrolase [Paracoccaceae bacterium]